MKTKVIPLCHNYNHLNKNNKHKKKLSRHHIIMKPFLNFLNNFFIKSQQIFPSKYFQVNK